MLYKIASLRRMQGVVRIVACAHVSLQLDLKDSENSLTRFRIAGSRIWLEYLGEGLIETVLLILRFPI